MKENDPLGNLLRNTSPHVDLPPHFHAQVWQRIADRSAARETAWQKCIRWWQQNFLRPIPATAFAAIVLVSGLALGDHYGSQSSSSQMAAAQTRYFQSIDPLAKASLAEMK